MGETMEGHRKKQLMFLTFQFGVKSKALYGSFLSLDVQKVTYHIFEQIPFYSRQLE